jgi:hypothetical protein
MSRASEGIWFPITRYHHPHDPNTNHQADDDSSNKASSEDPSGSQPTPISPNYRSPIGSSTKASLINGYTRPITDRVEAGWSCHLVTVLFSQLPGPRPAVIAKMKDGTYRLYSTLVTRIHRKPRTASIDELPVLNGAPDLPVHKRDRKASASLS